MTDATAALRHQIGSATDLQSVVRTMRALAASSIQQYERSVLALADYLRAVNLGLGASLRLAPSAAAPPPHGRTPTGAIGAIVFGSDQGLVGRFNEVIVEHAIGVLRDMPGRRVVWAVGERVLARLQDAGVEVAGAYPVPGSVEGIASLVDRLQFDTETHPSQTASPHIHLFHNRPMAAALYEPVGQRLLPLDDAWRTQRQKEVWPAGTRPEVMGHRAATLRSLIREHLFISLYRACAESLASENARRLAAMERADKNIEELLATLRARLHSQRQSSIDEELFDVFAGFEAVSGVAPVERSVVSPTGQAGD
ncbi:MAG: F0F1 ATP synthase subunit gamma [Burkholderiaceae bacterium]